ncbi:MAG: hypothetical protein MI976_30230 [Pseudomonadales bacterium]|nr:hypothetical protein [Pseudomonadales bacterium]
MGIARAADELYRIEDAVFLPIDYKKLFLIPKASAAHARECIDEKTIHSGAITITDTRQIDPYRCIRWIQSTLKSDGNFKLRTQDNRFHQVGFPYLTWIANNFIIDGEQSLDEAYFPRLSWVGGNITFDLRNAVEYVDTPALTNGKTLTVHFRSNNVDLNGQNNLAALDTLILNNALTENFPLLNGLANLESLNHYRIKGGDVLNPNTNNNPNDGGFLEKLITVNGNILIETHNMSRLYGLGNIETINGNVTIQNVSNASTQLSNLQGFEKIQTIHGSLKILDVYSLGSLAGINNLTVNHLELKDNSYLTNVAALQNISINNYGSVTFENLHPNACPGILNFIAGLNNTISINNLMNCE